MTHVSFTTNYGVSDCDQLLNRHLKMVAFRLDGVQRTYKRIETLSNRNGVIHRARADRTVARFPTLRDAG